MNTNSRRFKALIARPLTCAILPLCYLLAPAAGVAQEQDQKQPVFWEGTVSYVQRKSITAPLYPETAQLDYPEEEWIVDLQMRLREVQSTAGSALVNLDVQQTRYRLRFRSTKGEWHGGLWSHDSHRSEEIFHTETWSPLQTEGLFKGDAMKATHDGTTWREGRHVQEPGKQVGHIHYSDSGGASYGLSTPPLSEDYVEGLRLPQGTQRERSVWKCGKASSDTEKPYTMPYPLGVLIQSRVDGPFPLIRMQGSDKEITEFDSSVSECHYRWDLRRLPPDQLELVVTPEGYESWRPEGAQDEVTPGNHIRIRAKLQTISGKDPPFPAVDMTFTLSNTSKEPGVCMNWPSKAIAGGGTPDLYFDPEQNPDLLIDKLPNNRTQQKAVKLGELTEATAVVSARDWGAFGTLTVVAFVPQLGSSSDIVGHWEGDPFRNYILLPKRQTDSKIADAWKEDRGATGLADDDDSENDPAGDGFPGDGLSLYEEYRGFRENGEHIHGYPTKKDFFVLVPKEVQNGKTRRGIKRFAKVTGLEVHGKLREDEAYQHASPSGALSRFIINFNHKKRDPLHLVDQHGVPITKERLARHIGGRYLPWNKAIEMSTRGFPDPYDAISVAHELGHAVGIAHHGHKDLRHVKWERQKNKSSGKWEILEAGNPITVEYESGRLVPPLQVPVGEIYVAVPGGQHSGREDCLMRYACADALAPAPGSPTRILWSPGKSGGALCDSGRGTGVNDSSRRPNAEDATEPEAQKRGCKGQIRVSDR